MLHNPAVKRGGYMDFFTGGSSDIAYLGSILGLIAFIQALLPRGQDFFHLLLRIKHIIDSYFETPLIKFEIPQYTPSRHNNQVYDDVLLYVGSIGCDAPTARKLVLWRSKDEEKPSYTVADTEEVVDKFEGLTMIWKHEIRPSEQGNNINREDDRFYTLKVEDTGRKTVISSYMNHIRHKATFIRHNSRHRMLYTNTSFGRGSPWGMSVPLKHPATFDTMAMDIEMKKKLIADLDVFMQAEDFYKRVGRSWKRGYLLYGPPGTGKSSLIAAISNYTGYDIYDLELTHVTTNMELRDLLVRTSNKSIIVIEDIDCSLKLTNRLPANAKRDTHRWPKESLVKHQDVDNNEENPSKRVTLSGLLNFTDGLWSCCGNERIIIFTTNYIDQIDPALLRSGRMDLHILMSYCSFEAFKVLARTHLEIHEHHLYPQVESSIKRVNITPAQVADVLIQNTGDADAALKELVQKMTEMEVKQKDA